MNEEIFSPPIYKHFLFYYKFTVRLLSELMARQSGNWNLFIILMKTNDSFCLNAEFIPSNLKRTIPIQSAKYITPSNGASYDRLIINGRKIIDSSFFLDDRFIQPVKIFGLIGNRIPFGYLKKWEIVKSIFQKYRVLIISGLFLNVRVVQKQYCSIHKKLKL